MRPEPRKMRYLQILGEAQREWAAQNTAPRFAPDEHPEVSDYNVEVLNVEATGDQVDELERITQERLAAEGLLDLHPAWLISA